METNQPKAATAVRLQGCSRDRSPRKRIPDLRTTHFSARRLQPQAGTLWPLGVWRSLVARSVRVGEVPSSNLGTPISGGGKRCFPPPAPLPLRMPLHRRGLASRRAKPASGPKPETHGRDTDRRCAERADVSMLRRMEELEERAL